MSMDYTFIPGQDGGAPVKAWIGDMDVEDLAMQQLRNVARLPFIHHHACIMPDVHAGYGPPVGAVIPMDGAIVPYAVGVDIGCGMVAGCTNVMLADVDQALLPRIRNSIERAVPHGRTDNGGPQDKGAWGESPNHVATVFGNQLEEGLFALFENAGQLVRGGQVGGRNRAQRQLATLGTGNHFIEICKDEQDRIWIMLHSGSRGIGGAIGNYYAKKAREMCDRWFIDLPSPDLAYIPRGEAEFGHYMKAVAWAQRYARINRDLMFEQTRLALGNALGGNVTVGETVNCHHNYVSEERHFGKDILVTRKGAVSARQGELGIIPGAMGRKSFIVEGKGNRDSFHFCSHGAGRRMSRKEAKRQFSVEDHKRETAGLECRKDAEVIDETPAAYKSIDEVMSAQASLVDIRHTLNALVCVKG